MIYEDGMGEELGKMRSRGESKNKIPSPPAPLSHIVASNTETEERWP
jgi:hypothetical protein